MSGTGNTELTRRWQGSLMDNYGTPRLPLVRGEGARVWDADGKEYLDLVGGIAVNALGHAHLAVVEAVTRQIGTLGHVSNLFVAEPPVALAERLLGLFGRPGRVFFCNSGAEAVEGASSSAGSPAAPTWSPRTAASTAGPWAPRPHRPARQADPLPAAARRRHPRAVRRRRGAAGRGHRGHRPGDHRADPGRERRRRPAPGYLKAAREITRATGTLLVLDEVQTGIGRCGHWFAAQAEGVEADVVTLAKGLGGGLPIGATVAFGPAADLFGPGHHGTTFGGNPVACAAGLAVLDTLAADAALDHVKAVGERLRQGIEALGHPLVSHVRGAGLLLGIVLTESLAPQVQQAAQDAGLLVNAPAPDVVRIMPSLLLTDAEADAFVRALPGVLDVVNGQGRSGE